VSDLVRNKIPVAIMIVLTVFLFIVYFFAVPKAVSEVAIELVNWTVVLAAFAWGLGALSMAQLHIKRIREREPGQWYYSIWLIFVMIVMAVVGITQGIKSYWLQWLYRSLVLQPSSTLYSVMAFALIYAAYISFRLNKVETAYMVLIWLISAWGTMPMGESLIPVVMPLKKWIEVVPNTAGNRGFLIAMTLSYIAISFRTIVGRSRA
jgi:hypothetical protein